MIIDARVISGGISAELLAKLIRRHERNAERCRRLRDYYEGRHDILKRRIASSSLANNRIVCNHAKYIVDTSVAYLVGNAVTYAASDGYDIEPLKNAYLEQDMQSLDFRLEKHMSIYGRAYELIYMDENAEPKSAVIDPEGAFVAYSDDCTRKPLFGVHYYRSRDVDGQVTDVVCNVYTDSERLTYRNRGGSVDGLTLTERDAHYFDGVPVIEYINNDEKQGDFEQAIPLIDAYNKLQSDRVNDKENFVDGFLFLRGVEIDTEQAKRLKDEKILISDIEEGDARYLSKVLTESDMKILRDNLKEDIHKLSMTPDLSDESFGNNLSGVAIKYKLMMFENHVKMKEGYFAAGLKQRFRLYNNILATKGAMKDVPIHRVDVVFTHNLPANNLETAEMIDHLSGLVTRETLIDQLDFISDAKEEARAAREEQSENLMAAAEAAVRADREPDYNYGDYEE